MRDRIVVRGVSARGRHGLEGLGERDNPQTFVADVEARVSRPASDDIEATLDYRDIARVAREVIEGESMTLVERVAETIADRVIALGAQGVFVRVMKPDMAKQLDVGEIGVIVERP